MDIHQVQRYDAPAGRVFAMLTDHDYLAGKTALPGHQSVDVLGIGPADGGTRVEIRRVVESDIPGFAKKVLGKTNTLLQTDDWGPEQPDGSRAGVWRVETPGTPVKAGGTIGLSTAGSGSVLTIDGKVTVSVPLVGGKIADFVGKASISTMEDEEHYNTRWLSDHPA